MLNSRRVECAGRVTGVQHGAGNAEPLKRSLTPYRAGDLAGADGLAKTFLSSIIRHDPIRGAANDDRHRKTAIPIRAGRCSGRLAARHPCAATGAASGHERYE